MSRWPQGAKTQRTTFGGLTRSQLMARVRSRGNKTTEIVAVKLFRTSGITGWRRHAKVLGRPDFVWPQSRVALFVDGCFWHGHGCGRNLTPRTNVSLWQQKIINNRERDHRNTQSLRRAGWKVVRIWECALKTNPLYCIRRVKRALEDF